MDKVGLLRAFEDEVGVLAEKGRKGDFHLADYLDFGREHFSDELFNFVACGQAPSVDEFLVAREHGTEGIVR